MVYDYLLIYVLGLRFFETSNINMLPTALRSIDKILPYFVKNINIKLDSFHKHSPFLTAVDKLIYQMSKKVQSLRKLSSEKFSDCFTFYWTGLHGTFHRQKGLQSVSQYKNVQRCLTFCPSNHRMVSCTLNDTAKRPN